MWKATSKKPGWSRPALGPRREWARGRSAWMRDRNTRSGLNHAAGAVVRVLQAILKLPNTAGHEQLPAVLQDDEIFTARARLQRLNALQVNHDGTADPEKQPRR